MWVLKLKMNADNFVVGPFAKRFNVDIYGYPLGYEKKKNHIELNMVGIFVGDDKKKAEIIKILQSSKAFVRYQEQKGFFLVVAKQPLAYELLYHPKLIRVKPDFISKHGYHIWEIASWEKKNLDKIFLFAKKHLGGEILKFKEEKLESITFHTPYVNVTEKQMRSFEFAINQGYYEFPRKINLHKLASKAKQSYATFQEHLRKAESKIIPFFKKL